MRLIIAECHSDALVIARALDWIPAFGDGYLDYGLDIITWMSEFDGLSDDDQHQKVERLLNLPYVTELVNACDPGGEGEAIFHRLVSHARIHRPTKRLRCASLERDAIREAFAMMKQELQQTKEMEIAVDMGGWTLTSEQFEDKGLAEKMLALVSAADASFDIVQVRRRRERTPPPRLYDLAGLQKDMSKMHGLTAARTLAALHSLYEAKLTTCPRADSEFITHDDLDTLHRLTEGDRLVDGFIDPASRPAAPRLGLTVNDGKVAGHTAILPTGRVDKAMLDGLGQDERLVLIRAVRRMWEAVADDYVHDVTAVRAFLSVEYAERHMDAIGAREGEVRFTSRSDAPVAIGWKSIEGTADDDVDGDGAAVGKRNVIPANLEALTVWDTIIGSSLREGTTRPPEPFTERK